MENLQSALPPFSIPPEEVTLDILTKLYKNRDDAFWGIEFALDEEEHDEHGRVVKEYGHSGFTRQGNPFSATCCTGYAIEVMNHWAPGRVKIRYITCETKVCVTEYQSEVLDIADGHDFAVLDGVWVIDPWVCEVEELTTYGPVFDMNDYNHFAIVQHLYGNPWWWRLNTLFSREETDHEQ